MEEQKATMVDWEKVLRDMSKRAHTRPVFVLFTAGPKDNKQPSTSWCSDCNRCVPAVHEAAASKGAFLLEVSVGDPSSYKAPDFELRTRAEFQPFEGVPLLAAFKGESFAAGMDLQPCKSHEDALEAATSFMASQMQSLPDPMKCPYVRYSVYAGVVVLVGVAIFIAVAARRENGGLSRRSSSPSK